MNKATAFLFICLGLITNQFILSQDQFKLPDQTKINEYWYSQGAEITSFDLKQHRYKEVRQGYLVNVFVTEPFNQIKQVKSDNPKSPDAIPILKLNQIKKFNTGIYQYSLMTSIFTPFNNEGMSPIKITTTVQEWCGHIFLQLNKTKDGYKAQAFSYFESEGDHTEELKDIEIEDNIWSTIRLNPNKLKQGQFMALPSTSFLRLMHKEIKAYSAKAQITIQDKTALYTIQFPELNKTLEITFEKEFPFKILTFKESYPGLKNMTGDQLVQTTGIRIKEIHSFYWEHNKNSDTQLQKDLKLDTLLK